MARVYFDTSFFIAAIEDQQGRQLEAEKILDFERRNARFTSILTLQEFLVRTFDRFRTDPGIDVDVG